MTATEMALTIGSGRDPGGRRVAMLRRGTGTQFGTWPAALLIVFTILTAVSIVWSVQPDASWEDAGRMLAYSERVRGSGSHSRASRPAQLAGGARRRSCCRRRP